MENHVTSLTLSRELWEAGLRLESEFYWVHFTGNGKGYFSGHGDYRVEHKNMCFKYPELDGYIPHEGFPLSEVRGRRYKMYPALLASEFRELLPDTIGDDYPVCGLVLGGVGLKDKWYVRYGLELEPQNNLYATSDNNLSDAMAKMLLHLIREGLVDVKSLNGEWKI